MAPSNYMNYYSTPAPQQQSSNYNYNTYSDIRTTPASNAQYQAPSTASSTAPPAQDPTYPQYARTNDRYHAAPATANYSNRTNYDTNTIGALSQTGAVSTDTGRSSVPSATQGYSGYSAPQVAGHTLTQTYAPPQPSPASYNLSTHTGYGQQQARPDSVNSIDSSQSGLSVPTPVNHQSSQARHVPYQHQSATAINQRARSPVQPQWTASNISSRTPQHVHNQPWQPRTSRATEFIPETASRVPADQAPAPVTVNPTQVYDPYQEYQRKAKRQEAEAEQRRVIKAAEAAEEAKAEEAKAEEAARAAKAREEEASRTKAANDLVAAPPPQPATAVLPELPAKKKRARKSEGAETTAKPKTRNRKSAPVTDIDEPAQAAAMTLMQTANGTENDLESEMLEMFKRMRQFNAMNPEMLSRLWQQERDQHLSKEATKEVPAAQTTTQTTTQTPMVAASKPPKEASGPSSHVKPKVTAARVPAAKSAAAKATGTPSKKGEGSAQPWSAVPAPVASMDPTHKDSASVPNSAPAGLSVSVTASVPPAITSPQMAKNSGTIWPADKKQTLAATASRLLQNMPINQGKLISASEISAILDTNPSYIELCQKIESQGFKVDRGAFAKALLAAVPDVNKSAQKPMLATATGPSATASTSLTNEPSIDIASVSATASLSNAADRLLNGGTVVESPARTPSRSKTKAPRAPNENAVRQRKEKKAPATNGLEVVEEFNHNLEHSDTIQDNGLEGLEAVKEFVDGSWHEVTPATAANTAHKTTKTPRSGKSQARASVATQPAPPATKEDLARKRTFADLVDLTQLDSDDEPLLQFPPAKRHEGEYTANSNPAHLPTPPETLVGAAPTPRNPPPIIPLMETATSSIPMQPFHPTVHAQQGLQLPAGPTLPPNYPARTVPMVQPLDKYKAIRRSTYNPKTIARDVLLACGRHPDMRHLNAHLEALKTVFTSIDNAADLGTFRWDIADPGGPPPGSGNQLPPGLEELDLSDDADDEGDDKDNDSVLGRATVRQVVGLNGASTVEVAHASGSSLKKNFPRKSRHSEPGVRFHADQPGTRPRHSEGTNGRPTTTSEKPSTPAAGAAPSGYSAFRTLGADGTPVKKKGRPVGWRKWMMKDPSTYAAGNQGPKGKPLGTVKPAEIEPEPVYQVYKCNWRDCGAELHNLVTLRKHIYKLHGKRDEKNFYPCHWNECGKVRSITENGRTSSRFVHEEFAAGEPWKQHMERRHIQPIAWELGDGPVGGLSDQQDSDLSDAYLSDSRGRRVTPIVVVPSPAAAAAAATPRGMTNAEREARELQRIAEKRKRDMGPGIDKGGARLANDKRRQGFVDDDDTAEVVDEDD